MSVSWATARARIVAGLLGLAALCAPVTAQQIATPVAPAALLKDTTPGKPLDFATSWLTYKF